MPSGLWSVEDGAFDISALMCTSASRCARGAWSGWPSDGWEKDLFFGGLAAEYVREFRKVVRDRKSF